MRQYTYILPWPRPCNATAGVKKCDFMHMNAVWKKLCMSYQKFLPATNIQRSFLHPCATDTQVFFM